MYNLKKYNKLNTELKNFKKEKLAFGPTKIHKLENLSAKYGVNIYLKRDDLIGFSSFGGNKIRKLEYLFAELLEQGAEYVFTYGATQSNHAMQTAIAARKFGLKPILYLVDVIGEKIDFPRSNMLLDKILGAEIKIIEMKDSEGEFEAMYRAQKESKKYAEKITENESQYYLIPPGGASPRGSLGFVDAYLEMKKQEFEKNLNFSHIFHPTGTGGTLAGLSAANLYLEDEIQIHGINVSHKDKAYRQEIADLANNSLKLLELEIQAEVEDIRVDSSYVGPGYEIPTEAANRTIKIFAENEGIFFDSVYTGKAAAGLLDYLEKGKLKQGSDILFWHTGGTTGLFAEPKLLGNLIE